MLTRKLSLSNSNLIKKFSHGLFLNVLIKLKGVIYMPFLVNFFAKEQVGIITFWQSIASLLAGLILFNMPDSSVRVILKDKTKKAEERVIGTISFISILTYSLFIALSFLILYNSNFMNNIDIFPIAILAFSLVFNKISMFIFQIYQNTNHLVLVNLIAEYGSFLLIISLLIFTNILSPLIIPISIVAITLAVSLYNFKVLSQSIKLNIKFDNQIFKRILGISLYLFPNAYSLVLIQSLSAIFIKRYSDLATLGEYSLSISIASIVAGISIAINFFWNSTAVKANDNELTRIFISLLKIFPIVSICLYLFFSIVTEPLVGFINKEYINIVPAVKLLLVGFLANILVQIISGILYSRKLENMIFISTFFGLIFCITSHFFFSSQYTLESAAITLSLTYIFIMLKICFLSIYTLSFLRIANTIWLLFINFFTIILLLILSLLG